jgi:hypothetical protein
MSLDIRLGSEIQDQISPLTGDLPENVVLAFSPGYCCWCCEKPLPPGFAAVYSTASDATLSRRFLFLTCSPACQAYGLQKNLECAFSMDVEPWSPSKVRHFLDYPEKLGGVAISSFPRDSSLKVDNPDAPIN